MTEERTALAEALDLVGDRWSLQVVDALLGGPRRFGELQAALPGVAPNVLTQRLRHLEREGVVVARPYQQRPLRMQYQLTETGAELASALRLLAHWGMRRRVGDAPAPDRHGACGTPLETRWWCPTCARVVEDREDAELHQL